MKNSAYAPVKRTIDVLGSATLLVALSPVFLAVATALKIENPTAPVFYAAPRVGRNYRIFPFFKFRSMRPGADRDLQKMQSLNLYAAKNPLAESTVFFETQRLDELPEGCLLSDQGWQNEAVAIAKTTEAAEKPFLKVANDPRITRVGHFIRNTSIDELPQLLNVFLGHMSLVGNRPLPPYEAEQLTADGAVARFLAPAGITGLWQVTERGKSAASAESRKRLDAAYAEQCSLGLDFWIMLRTPVAALQKADV